MEPLIQVLHDSTPFHYPQSSLAGQGRIYSNVVSFITPEAQMLCHTGYKPQAKDIHDVRLLQQYFNFPLPEEYVGVVADFG
jgi:lincosamide nucleotidyltransferase A/C/D/E